MAPAPSESALRSILDSLDAIVYVADMDSHELLFINAYARTHLLGGMAAADALGRRCWASLQSGQAGPCDFCTNPLLLDAAGRPAGVHVWEFRNTSNQRWYQCRDTAIRWSDGRLVRLEIATDITDRKLIELQLDEARHQAEQLANTDELTGLPNRRAFQRRSARLLAQMRRMRADVSLLEFDLDHFKSVNDTWGHPAGDRLLCAVAEAVLPLVREGDVVGRIGGEEFALTLVGGAAEALQVAQRLREVIAQLVVRHAGAELRCTASVGVASLAAGEALSFDELMVRADQALYQAKRLGRDRVELAIG